MKKSYLFKNIILKITTCALLSLGISEMANAQTTIARPWFEGFSSSSIIPSSLTTFGHWETGESPITPGNPGGVLATGHWESVESSYTDISHVLTPNITGILASDTFSFDYLHQAGFPNLSPTTPGGSYFLVYISTDEGANFTQIDSVASITSYNWQTVEYPLAAYVGESVQFKIESHTVATNTLQLLAIDNFNLDGTETCIPPIVDLGDNTSICEGDTLTLDAGNPGATYLWSDSSTDQTFDITDAGTYWVEVTISADCSATDTIEIGIKESPEALLEEDIIVTGDFPTYDFNINDANQNFTYTWDFCGEETITGAEVSRTFTDTADCNIIITVSNECGEEVLEYLLTHEVIGINDIANDVAFEIYPNPASSTLYLNTNNGFTPTNIKIYNTLGQEVKNISSMNNSIDISTLKSGFYVIVIDLDSEKIIRKFEVNR